MARSGRLVAAALACGALASFALTSCSREEPRTPPLLLLTEADVAPVLTALRSTDGAALDAWLRPDRPVRVVTACPSCPPQRREATTTLGTMADARTWAMGLVEPGRAPADNPRPAPLHIGAARCELDCCTFAAKMVEHASFHLTRLCFDGDASGLVLREVGLVDGG